MRPDLERPSVIFDSHHPKHYLTVRRLANRCRENGIRPVWTARDKDVLLELMRADGNEPHCLTQPRGSLLGKLGELALYDWRLARLARRVRPLALTGKAISLAHVGRVLGIPSLLINDDSAAANPQYRYLGYPFAHRILTSECLGECYGPRQRTYPGLMELAYLHPNAFTPDPGIRNELGVAPHDRLFLIRRAEFKAYHDVGQRGLSVEVLRALCQKLSSAGRVYVVSEAPLDTEFAALRLPLAASRLHHLLAACDLVVGDGLTVVVEAALLGTPAIAFGSHMRRNAYVRALEQEFDLLRVYRPGEENDFIACVDALIADADTSSAWRRRRARMLAAWQDPTEVYWEELSTVLAIQSSRFESIRSSRQPLPEQPEQSA